MNVPRLFTTSLLLPLSLAAILQAADAKPAEKPKINYDEHVRPIFREHCFTCHNQNESKGGLALDSYAAAMEGGSSGEVIYEDDIDASRLWALVNHDEEPAMPPKQEKLAAAKLELIKQWIQGGSLENAGSKAKRKKQGRSLELAANSGGAKPVGEPAMPSDLWKQPVVYTPRAGAVTAIAASPWAPLVAVAGQKQIVMYNSASGERLGILPFPEGVAYVLRFSRNGELLLAGGGRGSHSGCVVLFDVRTGNRLTKLGDELDVVLSADINEDHSRVAMAGPQRIVRIFDTATGEQLYEINKHTDWVYAVEFSPDGVLLATADRSNGLFVWEAETARMYMDLRGHSKAVCDVAWRPDSNVLASSSMDGTVRLWDMFEGKQLKSWNAHSGGTMSVAYTGNGQIVSAGQDKRVKLWDGNGKGLRTFPAFPEAALEAVFTFDGKRVIGGDWSGQIKAWETADGKEVAALSSNPLPLGQLAQQATAQAAADRLAAERILDKLTNVNESVLKSDQAVSAARQRLQTATAANRQATSKHESSQKAVAETSAQLKTALAALEKAKAAAEAAQNASQDAQSRLSQAVSAVDQSGKEMAQAKADLQQQTAAQEKLQKQLAQMKSESASVQAKAQASLAKADTAKSQWQQFQALGERLSQAVAQATQAATEAAEKRKQLDEQGQQALETLVQQQTAADEMAKRIERLKKELEQLQSNQRKSEKAAAALRQALAEAERQAEAAAEKAQQANEKQKVFEETYRKDN